MPDNLTDIAKGLADVMKRRFTPPEFIPGCKVVNVDDVDQYAANNGWIEAICGQHNQQRCRWRGQYASIAVDDYVDVMYFPDRRLFEVHRQGGSGALSATGNVIGPGSSTDNAIARWDGTAGYTVQDSGVTVDDSDNISTAGDIFPQSSINGLNARFERLFGDDVPADPIDFIPSTWFIDDAENNKLGFETDTTINSDSYTPSSPFSKSNTGTVYCFTRQHHLIMRTVALSNSAVLQWTDSTAKSNFTLSGMFGFLISNTSILQEIRIWNVQSPSASDDYYGVRWVYDATTYPDWPYRIKLFTGTGITFAVTDGTEQADATFDPTARYWINVRNTIGSTRCLVTAKKYLYGSYGAREILDYGSGAFGGFKTVQIFVQSGTDPAIIDSIQVS